MKNFSAKQNAPEKGRNAEQAAIRKERKDGLFTKIPTKNAKPDNP